MSVALAQPTIGSTGWGGSVNNNFAQIQAALQTVGFRVNKSSAQTIVTGAADAVVQFNNVEFDTASAWSASNFWYTVPVAGLWQFNASISTFPVNNGGNVFIILATGAGTPASIYRVVGPPAGAAQSYGVSLSTVLSLAAATRVQIMCACNGVANVPLIASSVWNSFSGALLAVP